ncbi:unnamed protein product [Paramecium primaurelia]|uniref:Uncharacterized protein n=1 Tax=Paramecium primaurelia TaxID=5886 RepID=A0A8S1M3Q1_PARPR|nr:unnamed protein product [Paramecium primaurelia]
MKKDGPNISKVASDLIIAYKQLISQPRYHSLYKFTYCILLFFQRTLLFIVFNQQIPQFYQYQLHKIIFIYQKLLISVSLKILLQLTMKQNYIDILFSQLTESEKVLLPRELIINTILEDKNTPNIQIYNLLLAKLNKNGVDDLDNRLQKIKKTYKLESIIELIYKYRQKSNEQTIIQLLSKDENFFKGKFLQLNNPKGFESIYSEITMCEKYQEKNGSFLKFTLEDGSFIEINYKQDQIQGVYTTQKKRVKLLELIQNLRQKNSTLPGYIEFFEQKQNFGKNKIQIEFGIYTLSFGEFKQCGFTGQGQYKAEYFLQKCKDTLKYIIDIRYQDNDYSKIQEIHFGQKPEIELSPIELNSIVCFYFSGKKKLDAINQNNAVENIKIQEVIYDENKIKQKKYEEILKCKDDIFWELKQQKNKPQLDQILIDLVLNNFEFKTNIVLKVITENMDKIQQLNKQLNLEESQESILNNIVLEAHYTNLIQKGDTLQCIKVMDLLKQSFKHTENIKNKDIIIFLGATGSGKSTSINYYLGHELDEYEKYGKKFLKLTDEKNLSQDQFAKIGHSLAVSETTFIQGYKVQDVDNLMLCDCPGFDDTRGDLYDLNTMLSIDQTITNCKSIKSIVLTISYETFFVNRCQGIVQLFLNLQQLIPNIFIKNSARDSVFILLTKTNLTELNDHLMQLINDIYKTDQNILEKKSQSYYEAFKLEERIQIWKFVLYLIQKQKILSYSIKNQLMAEEQLELIINQPCIDKKYFCKAMDRMDIQIAFSKYIVLQIDTWQREIFENFFQDIPNQIKEAEGQILNKINSIKEKEKENNQKNDLIFQTHQKIKEAETQIKKLNQLIQSGDQSQIIKELENNNKFSNFSSNILKDAQDEKENIAKELGKKNDKLNKNQKEIQSLKDKISIIQNEINQLDQEIKNLQTGNSHKVLYEYKKLEEEMEFFSGDDNIKLYNQAFDSVSRFEGQGNKQKVKTSEYTGKLLTLVYLEKDFYIVPKGLTNQCEQMYNQEIIIDGQKYKAIIEGEFWSFEKGGKAQPDRKKMVYSIRTNWQKGRTLPWFKITHDLPNMDLNEGTILNKLGEIDSKKNTIIRKREDIKELTKENKDIQEDIHLKGQQIMQKEKIISEVKKEKGLEQIKDRVSSLTAFISNSKGEIELAQQFIVFNKNVIKTEQEHILKKEQELKNLQQQHLHFAIIIKSKIEIAQLLKVFAKISIDGLGISEKNQDANLKTSLESYSYYYDKMITEIQNLCEEIFQNQKNQYQKQLS